ncbi:hypothetical protein, partial [Stenotrophomonas geniculata]|uniref:hypothetical protein n=1 Tax=Stenotrophomonas geniculata TaxID=86188 RepID=UPI002E79C16E
AGGRCKYVHVSSVAASMRLTPPAPPLPATDSFLRHHGKDQKNQNQKPILQTFMTSAVSTKVDTYQSRMSF